MAHEAKSLQIIEDGPARQLKVLRKLKATVKTSRSSLMLTARDRDRLNDLIQHAAEVVGASDLDWIEFSIKPAEGVIDGGN